MADSHGSTQKKTIRYIHMIHVVQNTHHYLTWPFERAHSKVKGHEEVPCAPHQTNSAEEYLLLINYSLHSGLCLL